MNIGDRVVILTTRNDKYCGTGTVIGIKDSMIVVDSREVGKCYFHMTSRLSDSKLRKIMRYEGTVSKVIEPVL